MIDFEKQFKRPQYSLEQRRTQLATTFRIVYGWMAAGLAVSGLVAWYTAASGLYLTILSRGMFTVCIVAELALVMGLSLAIGKIPVFVAHLMFIAYAAVNGLTLSVVFLAYELASVQQVFFITAGMFGGLALWGTFTKGDLTGIGSFCGMALWGLVIAMVVNLFFRSSRVDLICSFVGIIVFTGLTMYDAQKIKRIAAAEPTMDAATVRRVGIMGALALYLDFVNLFLYILRFLGKKK